MKTLDEWETEDELSKELDAIEDKIRMEIERDNKKKLSPELLAKLRKLNQELEAEGV